MILSIIGIVLGLTSIGLIFWFRRDQEMTNDLADGDTRAMENSYTALMKDFINYQVETNRKITELEKQLKIEVDGTGRSIEKIKKELPNLIGRVVGQIEFAQDKINRQM